MERILPDGCPVVIGGGLIRDALMGGRPNDIDVWLPSNISCPDVDAFCAYLVRNGYGPQAGFQGQIIFRGPGANVEEVIENPFAMPENPDTEGYGDVHNHWVIEIVPAENAPVGTLGEIGHPRINIMRNMARWNGDAPSFFTEIMRNFDLDLCMYFVGYMPGQNTVNTVIMPQHLLTNMRTAYRQTRAVPTSMNAVYWNQARLETTSVERILSRVRKMNEKYSVRLPEDIERIPVVPTEEIIAVPVLFRDILPFFNGRHGFGCTAIPQRANRVNQDVYEAALATAQVAFQAYRARGNTSLNMTIASFLRVPF